MAPAVTSPGLRANAGQFGLLVAINTLVGAMVGLERSVLPLAGEEDFGLASKSAVLSLVAALTAASGLWVAATRRRTLLDSRVDARHPELARGSSR